MKKMGIFLVLIMLLPLLNIVEVNATPLDPDPWEEDFEDGDTDAPSTYTLCESKVQYVGGYMCGEDNYEGKVYLGPNTSDMAVAVAGTVHLTNAKSASSSSIGKLVIFPKSNYIAEMTFYPISSSQFKVTYGTEHNFIGNYDEGTSLEVEIWVDESDVAHYYIDGSEVATLAIEPLTHGPEVIWAARGPNNSSGYIRWADIKMSETGSFQTKDFASVEITSDKTHYDMTDTEAIFTVTVSDENGDPCTGCTIDDNR